MRFAGLSAITFIKKMRAVMTFAFSTSSSSATIPLTLNTLERRPLFTTIHMGSSRYFVPSDLDATLPDAVADDVERYDPAKLGEGIRVVRSVKV